MATKRAKPAKKKVAKKAVKKSAAKKPAAKKSAAKKASRPSVVHWEVQAKDPAKQQRFFADLFGWKIDANNPMGYGMVASGGKDAINGGIGGTEDAARVTVYVQVSSIDATLATANSLGATTVMPRTDMGMIIMGQFCDLEGNLIGLVEG